MHLVLNMANQLDSAGIGCKGLCFVNGVRPEKYSDCPQYLEDHVKMHLREHIDTIRV